MKKFVSKSMVSIWCLLGLLSASAAYAQTTTLPNDPRTQEFSLLGVGVYGGVDYRPITMDAPNFRSLSAFPTCCPQKYGTQTTLNWLAGISFDYTLTSWLLLDVRAHLFSAKADFSQQEKILVGVNGAGVETSIRHTLSMSLRSIGIEPSLKVRLLPIPITTTYAPSLYLQLGVQSSYSVASNYQYEESIAQDSPVRFLGSNGQPSTTRNQSSGPIPDMNLLQFALFAGLDSEIYLEREYPAHWILAPFARYYVPLTAITAQNELSWGNALQGGVALRYRFITPKN
jgi:hypothetical protein